MTEDPSYGDLQLLLTPEGPGRLLRASGLPVETVSRNYIRLKPGSGVLLGLTLASRDQAGALVELPGYIRSHDSKRAAQIAAKWHAGRSVPTALGQGVRLLAGGRSVLFLFPNDARVRGMRFVADVDKLKRTLSELPALRDLRVRASKTRLHVQRYKPERRLILRAELGIKDDRRNVRSQRNMFLRFFVDDRGEQLAQLVAELREQEVGQHVPEPLGCLLGGRMYAEQAVDGVEGLAHIEAGRADPIALARVVAKLHRAQVDSAASISNQEVLQGAVEAGTSLALLAPELEVGIHAVLEAMREQVPADGPQAFLHGDLHLHQVIWTEQGPVLVDFERSAVGHPLYDLGQALAHLQIQADGCSESAGRCADFAAGLRSEYQRIRSDLDFEALPFFITQGLLQRALLPARRLSEGWPSQCRKLVDRAWEQIATGPKPVARRDFFRLSLTEDELSWDRFYPSSGPRWPGRIVGDDGRLIYGHYDRDLKRFVATSPEQDRALPGLARALSRGKLVAYRPGRRAVVRCRTDDEVRFIKLMRPGRLTRVLSHHLAANAVGTATKPPFPVFPMLLEVDPASGALTFSELQGASLHCVLSNSSTATDARIEAVAQSIAALHRAAIPSENFLASSVGRSLPEWVDLVRVHDAGFAKQCQGALRAVGELPRPSMRPGLVHGDLHDRNIFLCERGVALLDLDDFGIGDPLEEIGNLMAHFVLRALQAGENVDAAEPTMQGFLDCYRRYGGIAPPRPVAAAIARTMIRLACLYRFRRSQAGVCGPLLAEAERLAGIGCAT